jgi:hypothetical protein
MDLINHIRFYHFISAVLENQQADPLCRECKALVNSVRAMREGLDAIKNEHHIALESVPKETLYLYEEAIIRIGLLKTSEKAIGQKSAGNCRMPKGVCFAKSSKGMLKTIE